MAFGDYVRSRGGMLLRSAMALTGGNRADAEDLVQLTLIKTFQVWDRISDLAALDTYVRRAMVNTHISTWRRRRVDEYPTDELPDQPVGDPTEHYDLQDVVQRALGRLPRQMRVAVILRYYDDLTEPEVSATMGVSVGTVKSTVARALAKLRNDEQLCADIAPYRDGAVFRVPAPRPDADPDEAASAIAAGAPAAVPGPVPGPVPGAVPGQRGIPGQREAPAPGAAARARPLA